MFFFSMVNCNIFVVGGSLGIGLVLVENFLVVGENVYVWVR